MKAFLFLLFFLSSTITLPFRALCQPQSDDGPYIDSLGFRAAQSRLDAVEKESPDTLITQAFRAQNVRPADSLTQPDFYQSLEESYQRYRTLFTLHRRGPAPSVYCKYDLLKTFTLGIFDPQPFMNAILHTLAMTDIATLSFDVQSRSLDRMLVRVSWAKAVSRKSQKRFSISEGNIDIMVTNHWISAIPVR
jgi:hypothetical protein